MQKNLSELEQIQEDFLSIVDNGEKLSPEVRKNLLKGVVRNFFDFLKDRLLERFLWSKNLES